MIYPYILPEIHIVFQCTKPCGQCKDSDGCDKATGKCNSGKCETGWEGDKCTKAMCKPDQCGWYGECVAPNQCRCPRKYTRVIKLDDDGHVDEVSILSDVTTGSANRVTVKPEF